MKCIKCGSEIKNYEDDRFCSKCGYPIREEKGMQTLKLESLHFDAGIPGGLWINGRRIDRLLGFEMKCNNRECSLIVSADEEYKADFRV